jgi:hypothetical protein
MHALQFATFRSCPAEDPRMHAHSRSGIALIGLVALSAMVGCGGSYDTPEATFQTMRVAANNKDMRGMFGCITDESLEMMAGALVLAVKTPMGVTANGHGLRLMLFATIMA